MITGMVVAHVMGYGLSIDTVMSTRASQGAIAWAVSLNTFPYLVVLGRSRFEGYVNARPEGGHNIRHVALEARELTMDQRTDRGKDDPLVRASELWSKIPVHPN